MEASEPQPRHDGTDAPLPPAEPPATPTERLKRVQLGLKQSLEDKRVRATRLLAHVRYVFGYLASGFLISVPISAASHLIGEGGSIPEAVVRSLVSIGYGIVCLVPFFALVPVTQIDWKRMTVPEYQLFDLKVTRSATMVSAVLCALSFQLRLVWGWVEPRVFWTVFVLILFSWARLKALTLLFPEFYRLEPPPS